ncbi:MULTISPECIES: hypothetical protein [Flavobacterium]|uniref:Uncharacterized protein n=1 Tax=Flavobacterium jumunjinense TaxID=998845 RepID=A0ABV5GQF2_9FLAO|nr:MULTISPECIES: hypothetical protein [Flavobacterium]
MKLKIIAFLMLLSQIGFAQDTVISQELYEGKLSTMDISLYLKIQEDGCPHIYATGMYKYKQNKTDNWLLLKIVYAEERNQFTMVEHFNTGVLILTRKDGKLQGLWISPDGKKQFEVDLTKVKTSKETIEKLEEKLDLEYYYANDC